jgi:hypothetical protein
MSKSNSFENANLLLWLNGTAITGIAQNHSTPLSDLYLSLHTGDPGEAGSQTTSECAYTNYARVAVARTSGGWTVTDNVANLTSAMNFPLCAGGTETATHFGFGTTSSGAGVLLWKGAVSPTIPISTGVTPQLGTGTTITED